MDKEIPLSVRKKEKRKQIIRFGLIILIIAAGSFITINILGSSISLKNAAITDVDKGPIEVTVNASGKVIPLNEEIIVSPINSRILEVYKNPGDLLDVGTPILKLELASIETEYNQRLDEKEMKKGKLIQTQIGLENKISELKMQQKVKEMQLKQMETELKNEKYLDSIGASTSDKVRQAAFNYEVAKLEYEQLKQKIQNQQADASAEIKVQQLDLSMFEKTLAESSRLLKDARILSPQRATLTYVNNQIGAQVMAGTQIAIVSDLSNFKVEAEIADGYAEKLSPGSKAIVKIGELLLEGKVVNITPSVKNGIIKFSVILNDPANPKLRSGIKTDVFVSHGIREDVLRIANGSYYTSSGDYDLWVVKGDKAEKRSVKLGEASFEYVEVIRGLEKGEKVIISDMSQYKSNKSLKVKEK